MNSASAPPQRAGGIFGGRKPCAVGPMFTRAAGWLGAVTTSALQRKLAAAAIEKLG